MKKKKNIFLLIAAAAAAYYFYDKYRKQNPAATLPGQGQDAAAPPYVHRPGYNDATGQRVVHTGRTGSAQELRDIAILNQQKK